MIKEAFANAAETAAGVANSATAEKVQQKIPFGVSFFVKTLIFFVIIYFIAIRPAQVRAKQHAEKLANVKPGSKVLIAGTIAGKVTKIIGEEAFVEIADKVEIKVMKSKITELLDQPPANQQTQTAVKDKSGKKG